MNIESCRCCPEDAPQLRGKLENIECVTQNAGFSILCLSKSVLKTVCIRTRRYINVSNLYNCNKTKSSIFALFTSQNQKLIKFLKFYAFDSANYSFYLLCIVASFLKKKVFYILTAVSSFMENVSINFEHKNFKSLIML